MRKYSSNNKKQFDGDYCYCDYFLIVIICICLLYHKKILSTSTWGKCEFLNQFHTLLLNLQRTRLGLFRHCKGGLFNVIC